MPIFFSMEWNQFILETENIIIWVIDTEYTLVGLCVFNTNINWVAE